MGKGVRHDRNMEDYPRLLRIRSLGRRASAPHKKGANGLYGGGFLRKPFPGSTGIPYLALDADQGKRRATGVNRLVLMAFVGPPPTPKHEAAHWDGDTSNNRPGNLRWATSKENHADKIRHGTTARGELQHMAKLTASKVIEIRGRIASGEKQRSIAASFNVDQSTIADINTGRTWGWLTPDRATA